MTGKGDRLGGRRLGRSEPALCVASTTALPPPTCTARREAGQHHLRLLCCCEACTGRIVCSCASRPVPVGSSAGCVCLQRLCSAGFACLPPLPCHAHCPCSPAPFCFDLPPPPCSFPCAPGSSKSNSLQAARTVPLAATTRVCSGGPCTVLHPPTIHCAARTAL